MTIRELAKAAGVSRGTVDRVLHNRKGVSPEIQARIRKLAKEMGYTPNRAGMMLSARKQPLTVGCLLPSIGNSFFSGIVAGFRDAEADLKDFGLSIVIKEVQGYNAEEHLSAMQSLIDSGCSALCVSTLDVREIQSYLNDQIDSGIAVVTVNNDVSNTKRLCYVGSNYTEGGSTAAGLLRRCSFDAANVLIVMGSKAIKGHNERVAGFIDVLYAQASNAGDPRSGGSSARNSNSRDSCPGGSSIENPSTETSNSENSSDRNPYLEGLCAENSSFKIIDILEAKDDDSLSYELTRSALMKFPEINSIYIAAAGAAGVCKAIADLNWKQRGKFVVSHDDSPEIRRQIKDGVIDFTICQYPEIQGKHAIKTLFDYFLNGKKDIPSDFFAETTIKIKENL